MKNPFVALNDTDSDLPKGVSAVFIELSDSSNEVPTELKLFSLGVTETTKGPFIFDSEAAQATLARFAELGKDKLPVDYNHGMLSFIITPESGKAAGWFVPTVKNGELWASEIQWTPAGLSALKSKEYRFYSPAVKRHYESNRVLEVINFALTNLPATKNQKPIVMSDGFEEEGNANMKLILQKLGVSEESEAAVRVSQLLSDEAANVALLSSLGFKTINELATAHAATKKANEAMSLSVRKSRIAVLSTEGRLPPAQHAFAESLSDEAFEGFVKTLPDKATPAPDAPALSLTPPPGGSPSASGGVPLSSVKLSEEELEMAKKFGQDPAELLSVKQELLSGAHPFQFTPKMPVPVAVK
jgi:phage I-like protein